MDSSARDAQSAAASEGRSGGLLHSLRNLLAHLLAVARTRGELLQVELEEEKLRVAAIAVFAVAAAVFLVLAVVVLTFFLILLFWDSNRIMATGLIALAYGLIGAAFALGARSRAREKSKLFAASLAELGKDSARLSVNVTPQ